VEDEHDFLERLRAGDEEAFKALAARHDGALRRVARTFVRTPSAADDVVQETWLAAGGGPGLGDDVRHGRRSRAELGGARHG
jgi:DNA-directed RNA polymerase specialized sigma24 family protein